MNPDIIGEALGIAGTIAGLIGDAIKNAKASDLEVAQQLEQLLVEGAVKFAALRSQLQADDAKIDEQVKEELAAAVHPKSVDAGAMPLAVVPVEAAPVIPVPEEVAPNPEQVEAETGK